MTTFLQADDADDVDFVEARHKPDHRVACFLHLRDLVYLHPEAASASAIAFVKKLEAAVTAEKAARERRLADARERDERRRDAERRTHEGREEKTEQATGDDARCARRGIGILKGGDP
jgi:hypothetical protein